MAPVDAQTDLPPGTVQLIDVDGTLLTTRSKDAKKSDIVLVPTPSKDPEDPLNWSKPRKWLATSCVVLYTIMICLPSTAVYSVTTPISKATVLTVHDLITGTGIMFLLAGWGCIPLQALALQYGKRPMYLATSAAMVAIMASAPYCVTPVPYYINKILQGIATAPLESLCEISMTDLWFTHERPRYLAVYGFSLAFAGKLAPSLAGFINYYMDWRWTLWWCAIGCAITFVYCFFLMEETNYDRAPQDLPSESSKTDADGSPSEKAPTVAVVDEDTDNYPRKTYWQKLSLIDKPRPNRLWPMMVAPFRFFAFPVVNYAGLMYGANGLVWSGIVNATAGTTYVNTYGFSTAGIAYAYLGGVVGVIVGAFYCGKGGEMLIIRLARRNKGVSESEHILWVFMASFVLVPFSLLLWGLGATYHAHWFALIFAQFALSISTAISAPVALGYAINSYPLLGGELVTTTVLYRNTMLFAMNYGIQPWIAAQGFRDTMITVAAIALVWNTSLFVMIKYGKKLRQMSAKRYWSLVQRARAEGMSH